jgi:UDP:flavonoid glycosyltransferase YjiC (YdhE family)
VRILAACSLGGAGHLNPLVPVLAAARRLGHETLVVGPRALTDLVERAGFRFRAGGEPAEAEIAPIREQLPVVPAAEASILGNRELFGRLAARALLPAMADVCADWQPDLVLRDPTEYASAVVVHDRSIPAAQVGLSLAEVEAGSIEVARPALEEHRTGLTATLWATPYLTRFPASLDPSPFATTVRFREPAAVPTPLPDWWPGVPGPLVYVSFGGVLGHMSRAAGAFRTALTAVADREARVLLTVGRAFDPAALGPAPAHVHVERWVDQADVLAGADLVVSHGGSGTTYGALAAGVPVVAVPMFADQFENARRVTAAGAGVTAPAGDAPAIAAAIDRVLADPSYARAAGRIAAEMAAVPPIDDVLTALLQTQS